MKKLITGLFVVAFLFITNPIEAQTPYGVNLTYNLGEQYDIPHSAFRVFHVPGVELFFPDLPNQELSFKGSMWFDDISGETSRTDLFIKYTVKLGSRFDWNMTAAFIAYHVPFTTPQYPHPDWRYSRQYDRVLNFEIRYKIKKP